MDTKQKLIKPPFSVDDEKATLGIILWEGKKVLPKALSILKPEDFYLEIHRMIYNEILNLDQNSKDINYVTVREALNSSNKLDSIGGAAYLMELNNSVVTTVDFESYANIVKDLSRKRKLLTGIQSTLKDYEHKSMEDILSEINSGIQAVTDSSVADGPEDVGSALATLEKFQKDCKDGLIVPISTGLNELDDALTGGFFPSDLVFIAGAPGTGKSSLALQIALRAARTMGVLYVSMEMPSNRLMARVIAQEGPFHIMDALRLSLASKEEIQRYDQIKVKIRDYKYQQLCNGGMNIDQLANQIEKSVQDYDTKLVIIDHVGRLMPSRRFETREREVAHYSLLLRTLAIRLNIVIVVITPLNKEGEKSKVAGLASLRDTSMMGYDASTVLTISNPTANVEPALKGLFKEGQSTVFIAKQRDGDSGISIDLTFHSKGSYFTSAQKAADNQKPNHYSGHKRTIALDRPSAPSYSAPGNHPSEPDQPDPYEEKGEPPF